MRDDVNQLFKRIVRYQTIRTIAICATVLVSIWWMMPTILSLIKH